MLQHPLNKLVSVIISSNYAQAEQPEPENPERLLPIIDKRFAALHDPQSLNEYWDPQYTGDGLSSLAFQASIGQIPMQFKQMLKEMRILLDEKATIDPIALISKILTKCDEAISKFAVLKSNELFSSEIIDQIDRYKKELTSLKTDFSILLAAEESKITQAKNLNIKPTIIIETTLLCGRINKIISKEVPYTAKDIVRLNEQHQEIIVKSKDVTGIDKQIDVLTTKMAALNTFQEKSKSTPPAPDHQSPAYSFGQ
jgi:hypothetical protein